MDVHPQAQALRGLPLIAIERFGEAPPRPLTGAERPLRGIRVLDLTRIIAGPVAGRALAAHGADVLRVIGPTLPTIEATDIDAGRGKRSAHCDLATEEGQATLRTLVRQADVVVQSYRPGALAARGFSPHDLVRLRPGLVVVSLSAYGHVGPWAHKRGFDSLVQTATGLNVAEADAAGLDAPRPLPAQALDHASGYLMALGAIAGLLRQVDQGGGWLIRVSLAGTGAWLRGLGRVSDGLDAEDPRFKDVADLLETSASGYGHLTAVRHAAMMSVTPPRWDRPSGPFGTDAPSWSA